MTKYISWHTAYWYWAKEEGLESIRYSGSFYSPASWIKYVKTGLGWEENVDFVHDGTRWLYSVDKLRQYVLGYEISSKKRRIFDTREEIAKAEKEINKIKRQLSRKTTELKKKTAELEKQYNELIDLPKEIL